MEKWEAATIQETSDVHRRFGTHKCVPYAPTGGHPIQHPAKFQFAALLSHADMQFILYLISYILYLWGCGSTAQGS